MNLGPPLLRDDDPFWGEIGLGADPIPDNDPLWAELGL
jgi:hypothetical protein